MLTILPNIRDYLYEACGNRFLIVPVDHDCFTRFEDFFSSEEFLHYLKSLNENCSVDSMMIIENEPERMGIPFMHVFEPRGHDVNISYGSWSTMCGNGIRAVVKYLLETKTIPSSSKFCYVDTNSGRLTVELHIDGSISVCMGVASFSPSNLSKYFNNNDIQYSTDLFTIQNNFGQSTIDAMAISIGLSGLPDAKGQISGEPHMVIRFPDNLSQAKISLYATEIGKAIGMDREIFPSEMNINIYSISDRNDLKNKTISVNLATFERGVYYVTQSCGTGSVMAAAQVFELLRLSDDYLVKVKNIGGELQVTKNNNKYFLTGTACKTQLPTPSHLLLWN